MTSPRRTVLFVLPSLRGGGAERVMVTLLRRLDRARFVPHLALVEARGPYLSEIPDDVPVHDLKASRIRHALPRLVRLTWKLRPEALLSTLGELNLSMVLMKPFFPPKSKLVIRENTAVVAHLTQQGRRPGWRRFLCSLLYRKADRVICLSDWMLKELETQFGIPREKMVRIYNPVDFERIRQLADENPSPFSNEGPAIVTAGRLSKEKGFDLLLEAMALVRKAVPRAQLTILGEGPLRGDLEDQCARLGLSGAVRFEGFRSNPYPFLKYADLFVLPSRYEGMPNALLEALALGTPVVAADCPGGVREVLSGGERGRLVPSQDTRALVEAIVSMCQSARAVARPTGAPPWMVQQFGIERVVHSYEEALSLER